jgi:hypothetical protein
VLVHSYYRRKTSSASGAFINAATNYPVIAIPNRRYVATASSNRLQYRLKPGQTCHWPTNRGVLHWRIIHYCMKIPIQEQMRMVRANTTNTGGRERQEDYLTLRTRSQTYVRHSYAWDPHPHLGRLLSCWRLSTKTITPEHFGPLGSSHSRESLLCPHVYGPHAFSAGPAWGSILPISKSTDDYDTTPFKGLSPLRGSTFALVAIITQASSPPTDRKGAFLLVLIFPGLLMAQG